MSSSCVTVCKLPRLNDYQRSVFMSSKKRRSSCPFESWKIHCEQLISSILNGRETNFSQGSLKKAPQRKKSGEKVSKLD